MSKTAIVLFNLGGPSDLPSVQPFLFNLFNDPAIIQLPQPFRFLLAKLISKRREKTAQNIYAQIGGASPILANTKKQADALERATGMRCFVSMRYWHPFVEETAMDVKTYAPDNVILLSLYPQFSTTTTASSMKSWQKAASKIGLKAPTKTICCYPELPGYVAALAVRTQKAYAEAGKHGTPRILFSAHGLPEKIVKAGDPYPEHCRKTVEALRRALNIENLDSVLCYQSRVGPLQWITPATDDEIRRAGRDRVPVVVVPIAFVSEHSETLVEIDREYRHLATTSGVPFFAYSGAVGDDAVFIEGLAELAKACVSSTDRQHCVGLVSTCPMG